jgi:hypothetical protein
MLNSLNDSVRMRTAQIQDQEYIGIGCSDYVKTEVREQVIDRIAEMYPVFLIIDSYNAYKTKI